VTSFLAPPIKLAMASPIFDGLRTTWIPAASRAAIFDFASPLPPEIIAPACPIRLPGGAVYPAIKLTTGRLRLLLAYNHAAASSSASPPISPIIIIPSVCGSTTNLSNTSIKLVPLKGSPPIPTTVD